MDRRRFLSVTAATGIAGCAAESPRAVPVRAVSGAITKIGIASCADQSKPQPLWNTVLADKPDLFIFAGDNVYASGRPFSIGALRQAYRVQERQAEFARLRDAVPHLAIWDDHDYGSNDGGAEFAFKAASKDAFLEFWRAPADDPRRGREGIYDARVSGNAGQRVQVIMLDTRWFRSPWKVTDVRNAPGKERYLPAAEPSKTMLGELQWQWLEQQLRQPADVRLIVSSIQVLADGHGWERWGNFPLEREKLMRVIAKTRAQGVVFLSGDRHIGALYRETAGAPYPLHELTSSGVTHPWAQANEAGPNRIGDLFTQVHYGTVEIDWGARLLWLKLKDIDGAPRRFHEVRIDDLKVRT
jgi:alkaline phosphatase D